LDPLDVPDARTELAVLINGAPFPSAHILSRADAIIAAGYAKIAESEFGVILDDRGSMDMYETEAEATAGSCGEPVLRRGVTAWSETAQQPSRS
jgi:hypothetical protein